MLIPESVIKLSVAGQQFYLSTWFRETGSDLTIFVHGLACSKHNFREAWQSEHLRDHALLAFDLPGFGRSLRPESFCHDLEEQANILGALIDQHASRRVHLVAHSLGGTIAVLVPQRSLARLQSLALVEARLLRESCGITAKICSLTLQEFGRDFLPEFRASLSAQQQSVFDLHRADTVAFYYSACSLMRWIDSEDLVARLLAVPCVSAFIYAETDRCQSELAALSDIERIFIPDAGHFMMEDNPELFYFRLLEFQQRSRHGKQAV